MATKQTRDRDSIWEQGSEARIEEKEFTESFIQEFYRDYAERARELNREISYGQIDYSGR